MTDYKPTQQTHVLVGIDISKHRHEVLISILGKKRRRRLTIQNKREDFERLVAILQRFQMPVCVGFEATGNYHRNLAYAVHQAGCELKLISSVALARTREALHNSWDKNDPKDALAQFRQRIAHYFLALLRSVLARHLTGLTVLPPYN